MMRILWGVWLVVGLMMSGCGGDGDEAVTVEADAAGLNNDIDGDGVPNGQDNCPETYNPPPEGATEQVDDNDNDGIGDVCDPDDDNDGVLDEADGCPTIADMNRIDTDNDGLGDACDDDADNDGVPNDEDLCPREPNFSVGDLDGQGDGEARDMHRYGDRMPNSIENIN
ncbi:MAG: thrombospondin type 3 repeat-containing protein [Myxococcota bacterium]|nr:thrombospondin type 3 repeat-containing protein [Myxococcota bacterium]